MCRLKVFSNVPINLQLVRIRWLDRYLGDLKSRPPRDTLSSLWSTCWLKVAGGKEILAVNYNQDNQLSLTFNFFGEALVFTWILIASSNRHKMAQQRRMIAVASWDNRGTVGQEPVLVCL